MRRKGQRIDAPPTMADLVKADAIVQPDFVTDGERSWCQHCGVLKQDTAKFFFTHHAECVLPRKRGEEPR